MTLKKAIIKYITTLLVFVAFGVLQKMLFMAKYHALMGDGGIADIFQVIWHGLPMDFSVAGYLTAIPSLLIIAMLWSGSKTIRLIEKAYFVFISALLGIIFCLDLGLYEYWGFKLDMTPIFYFTTSPSAALASVSIWQMTGGTIAIALSTWLIYETFAKTTLAIASKPCTKAVPATMVMTLLTAALFIPIRGGVTVSTMNLSRSYFSNNQRLNHAAVNPAFSLLYSATHQDKFSDEYRFMTTEEAQKYISELNRFTTTHVESDSICINDTTTTLFTCKRPDIYLVILESFSAHLMPSLGGETIAVNLDSLAREGVSFSNFYANSFRTDRALPSVLSGFPAQPSMSLLKYVDKIEHLPSLAGALKENGYNATYYYGGDINFANINAYLISSGFEKIICDKDFPLAERTGKWGAHDHLVFQRALHDATEASNTSAPQFNVIQTSSSHEPFDVPYHNPSFTKSPQKNAFAYTDSCLMTFVNELRQTPRWKQSIVLMVPDHLGAWPLNLDDATQRHHIPFVIAGGALAHKSLTISTISSQIDITATILAQLDIDTSAFAFSKDILNPREAHYAVFTEPSLISIVSENDTVVFNCDAQQVERLSGIHKDQFENQAKAYLQTIYEHITNL